MNNDFKIDIIKNKKSNDQQFTLQKLLNILKKLLIICFVCALLGGIIYLILYLTGIARPKVDNTEFENQTKEYINTINKAYNDFIENNDIRFIYDYKDNGKYLCMSILDFIKDKYVNSSEDSKKGYIQRWIFSDGTSKYYINMAKGNTHIKGYSNNLKTYDDNNVVSQCPESIEMPIE